MNRLQAFLKRIPENEEFRDRESTSGFIFKHSILLSIGPNKINKDKRCHCGLVVRVPGYRLRGPG
jgi:hypothetical protein